MRRPVRFLIIWLIAVVGHMLASAVTHVLVSIPGHVDFAVAGIRHSSADLAASPLIGLVVAFIVDLYLERKKRKSDSTRRQNDS